LSLKTGYTRAADTSAVAAITGLLLLGFVEMEPPQLKYAVWAGALLMLATLIAARGRLGLPARSLRLPLTVWLGWLVLAGLAARYPHAALESLIWLAALLAVALVMAGQGRQGLAVVALSLALSAIAVACWALLQSGGVLNHEHWANQVRNSGPWTNSNLFAAYLNLGLLAGAGLAIGGGSLRRRVIGTIAFLTSAASLALTGSRGGWLAAAVGMVVLVLAQFGARRRSRGWALAGLVLAGSAGLLGLGVSGRLQGVMERLRGAGDYSVDHRMAIYRDTVPMLRAHPLLGVGPGGYSFAIGRYRTRSDRFYVNFAHSDWLEAGATVGLPGLLLSLLLVGLLTRHLAGRVSQRSPDGMLIAGLAAGLAALAVQSLYGFPIRTVATGMAAFLSLGVIAGEPAERPLGRGVRAVLVGLGLALVTPTGMLALSQYRSLQAARAQAAGDLEAAAVLYARAAAWSLGDADLARKEALQHHLLANQPEARSYHLEQADSWYRRALAANPDDAEAWLGRAAVARRRGDHEAAARHFREAMAAAPVVAEIHRMAFQYFLGRDQQTAAFEALGLAMAGFPRWARGDDLARMADRLKLDDRALVAAVPPRREAVCRALADFTIARRENAVELLRERERDRLTAAHDAAVVERLLSRGEMTLARQVLDRSLERRPDSRRLLALNRRVPR
jgi:O-antigen ligase/tetratricopeptide (TPR) repeat protein